MSVILRLYSYLIGDRTWGRTEKQGSVAPRSLSAACSSNDALHRYSSWITTPASILSTGPPLSSSKAHQVPLSRWLYSGARPIEKSKLCQPILIRFGGTQDVFPHHAHDIFGVQAETTSSTSALVELASFRTRLAWRLQSPDLEQQASSPLAQVDLRSSKLGPGAAHIDIIIPPAVDQEEGPASFSLPSHDQQFIEEIALPNTYSDPSSVSAATSQADSSGESAIFDGAHNIADDDASVFSSASSCSLRPRKESVSHAGFRYTFLSRLGEGATSHVMLAHVIAIDEAEARRSHVAVKVFHKPQMVESKVNRSSSDMVPAVASIIREINFLRSFTEGPDISAFLTPLLASFQDDENVYLVMVSAPRLSS